MSRSSKDTNINLISNSKNYILTQKIGKFLSKILNPCGTMTR